MAVPLISKIPLPSLRIQFGLMIAVGVTACIGIFIGKLLTHYPHYQFVHLLASYEFGIIKRALLGEIYARLGLPLAPSAAIWVGLLPWLAIVGLFLAYFRRAFGFSEATMPLFVFTAGSPFFFKNFMFEIGYLDIFGCVVALIALLLPVGTASLLLIGLMSVVLLFIHNVHFVQYIPTIAVITAIRFHVRGGWSPLHLALAFVIALATGATFMVLTFYGSPPVPPDVFVNALAKRGGVSVDFGFRYLVELVWYGSIDRNRSGTLSVWRVSASRIPIYILLILLHAPLAAYFARVVRSIASDGERRLAILALVGITAGHLVFSVTSHDHSRILSNWAVSMMLAMFAVRLLRSADPQPHSAAIQATPRNVMLAWIVALVPRVGVTIPF